MIDLGGARTVERIRSDHATDGFDSGAAELDAWLRGEALNSDRRDAARVNVVAGPSGEVLAYSALVAATVRSDELSRNASGGISSVPVVLLGKLAVDQRLQGAGLGTLLLSHAIRAALSARERVAFRLLVVDARDDAAHAWYAAKSFRPIGGTLRLYARLAKIA